MRLLRYGESAVLVDARDLDEVMRLVAAVRVRPPAGVAELVPAAKTLLVTFDPRRTDHAQVATALRAVAGASPQPDDPAPDGAAVSRAAASGAVASGAAASGADCDVMVEIPVVYDGPDLAEVAARCRLTEDEVIRRHSAVVYTVAFGGFAPGFAYLRGLHPSLRLARRSSPRTSVPVGAVAIADEWSAVYPTSSPGGWHLLGRTGLAVWDTERQPPSVLVPGARVRFRPTAAAPAAAAPTSAPPTSAAR